MRKFITLLVKEWKEDRKWIFAISGILMFYGLYVFLKVPSWGYTSLAISLIPLILLPILPFFWGYFRVMQKESDTRFYILSLPVPKKVMIFSKVLAIMGEIFLFVFIVLMWMLFISLRLKISGISFSSFIGVWGLRSLEITAGGIFTFSIYLYSRCFGRHRGWIAFFFLIILLYLYADIFSPNFTFLDNLKLSVVQIEDMKLPISFTLKFFLYSIINIIISSFLFSNWSRVI